MGKTTYSYEIIRAIQENTTENIKNFKKKIND
jgi:hypothetical protein